MLGKIEFFEDWACTKPAKFYFGEVIAGEAKNLLVYIKNTGPTLIKELKFSSSRTDIEIINRVETMKPDEVQKIQIVWRPKIDEDEMILEESIQISGISVPVK